jgi:preprotein translocase subunit SecD
MEAARVVVENRVNGLGVTEPLVQLQGERRIIVELPGIEDPDQAIATLRETGLLEFVEAGRTPLQEGMRIRTSLDVEEEAQNASQFITSTTTLTDSEALTSTEYAYDGRVFNTIMTGRHLKNAETGTQRSCFGASHQPTDSHR